MLERLIILGKISVLRISPCTVEIHYFGENPCAEDFLSVLERLIFQDQNPCTWDFVRFFKHLYTDFPYVCSVLVDFENFSKIKKSLCWGFFPCAGEIDYFGKNPCAGIFPCTGEIGFFRVKIPVLEKFFALCSKKKRC